MGSIIVSVQSNKASALHIKRNWLWKPVSVDQKFGRQLHQTTCRKLAEVSLLSFQFVSSWETSASREGGAGWGTRPPLSEFSGSVPEICLRIRSGRCPIIYRIISHFYHVVCSRNFSFISVFITPHQKAWLRVLCKLLKKKLAPWHTYISLQKLPGLGFYKTLHIC